MIEIEIKDIFSGFGDQVFVNPTLSSTHYQDLIENADPAPLTPSKISKIKSKLNNDGFVVISTDLADFAPPTPTSLSEHYEGPYYAEAMLALISQTLGSVQILPHQHNGKPFHDIMPMSAFRDEQTSGSSGVMLEMHTELSFVKNPPEYLLLYCIRPDKEGIAETHLYDSLLALTLLSVQHCAKLSAPNFQFIFDANATQDNLDQNPDFPIIDKKTSRLLRFDADTCRPSDQEAKDAFDALKQTLLINRSSIRLSTGELLLIDNKRMVHSRSPFQARYDGNDRWLKRALVRGYQ